MQLISVKHQEQRCWDSSFARRRQSSSCKSTNYRHQSQTYPVIGYASCMTGLRSLDLPGPVLTRGDRKGIEKMNHISH